MTHKASLLREGTIRRMVEGVPYASNMPIRKPPQRALRRFLRRRKRHSASAGVAGASCGASSPAMSSTSGAGSKSKSASIGS